MKIIYILIIILLGSFISAQSVISFEANENYILGNLHGQNSWEVTESSDGIVQHQTVSNEQAFDGVNSFKNAYEPDYDFQWFPIFGGNFNFNVPVQASANFSISYNIWVTGQQGADFEFALYGVNANEEFAPVAGVGIENRGFIYLITDENYGFEYADATWEPNTWVNVRVELTAEEIKYFINNTLQLTVDRFNSIDLKGFNFLHNNYGHDAYYDYILINSGNMSISENQISSDFQVYPNPATNQIKISGEKDIIRLQILDIHGRILKETNNSNMNIEYLEKGTYIIKIHTNQGIFTRKLLKK
ncbi:MAG: T9SS type A sorting domain-containing protein [Flavobacteriaceae bacterium]|nr:T9SS type A sorting domain-containing protein [Flavobacteriaceae bacterium]